MKRQLLLFALLAAALPARADVTIESRLTIESVAGTGAGAVVTQTSGLRRREDRRLGLEGPFAEAQPETSQASIVHLDRAVMDRLYAADSTYDEVPLAKVLSHLGEGTAGAVPGFDKGASLDLTWTVTATTPGGEATIAGFTATPTVLTLHGKGTGAGPEIVLTLELWMRRRAGAAGYAPSFEVRHGLGLTGAGVDGRVRRAALGGAPAQRRAREDRGHAAAHGHAGRDAEPLGDDVAALGLDAGRVRRGGSGSGRAAADEHARGRAHRPGADRARVVPCAGGFPAPVSLNHDAGMAELADAADLKSAGRKPIRVQLPVPALLLLPFAAVLLGLWWARRVVRARALPQGCCSRFG